MEIPDSLKDDVQSMELIPMAVGEALHLVLHNGRDLLIPIPSRTYLAALSIEALARRHIDRVTSGYSTY